MQVLHQRSAVQPFCAVTQTRIQAHTPHQRYSCREIGSLRSIQRPTSALALASQKYQRQRSAKESVGVTVRAEISYIMVR